jgi:phosphate transport system substrate-binding protein
VVLGLAALVLGMGLWSAPAQAAEEMKDPNKIVIDGSTTVGPLAKAFATYYMKENPDVNITISESGSGNGAKSLVGGTCDIADMSRFMKPKEFQAAVENEIFPVAHVVAMDGIAMAVHPSNPVKNLTVEQIRNIYLGKVTNWKQLGGPDAGIVMITRDSSSGTFETFEKLVMNKKKILDKAEVVASNTAMRSRVAETPGAIGYVGLGFLDDSIKAITVNNVPATNKTISSGLYPIARPLFMVTDGYPKLGTHLHRFITTYLSKEGQKIVREIGFVPVTEY